MPNLLGHAPIAGGTRPVYLDANDQQFIVGRHGERLYGVWLDVEDLDGFRVEGVPHAETSRGHPRGYHQTVRC